MKEIFNHDDTLRMRKFYNPANNIKCLAFFLTGMVDENSVNENIIRPIVENSRISDLDPIDYLQYEVITSLKCEPTSTIKDIVDSLLLGDIVLFMEDEARAIEIGVAGSKTREIIEPESETVLLGPREGFTESLDVNLSLIRRKIKSVDLKFKYFNIGNVTNTDCCVSYIEGLADNRILDELSSQLEKIDIDGVLDVKYIQEYIGKEPFALFETSRASERPDVIAANLLEGRIALLLDGSPVVVTMPFLFIEIFQAPDDYYTNYYFASFNRIMRLFGFVATISIPAVYLSLVNFHQELIPTPLLMSIYASRLSVPLPTIFELIILLLAFEVLREAGSRMPPTIGEALSIVGALVLGTAAVDAKLVSAPVIIVVGLSGITSFMIPSITGPSTIIKFIFVGLSSFLGLYGYMIGMGFLLMYLIKLKSFGVSIMAGFTSLDMRNMQDTHMRTPRWAMRYRPVILGKRNPIRSKGKDPKQ